MKLPILAAAMTFSLCTQALAQSEHIWEPCLASDATMEGVIGAFQSEGWAFPASNQEHVGNLQTAAEPLVALQNLPDVQTGRGFDRHIQRAHERSESMLIDAATLQRDGLVVAIESYDNAGGMIRCTIAGNEFDEVAYAFEGDDENVSIHSGHETLVVPAPNAATDTDITLYRLLPPSDATAQARAGFAVITIRPLQ